LQEIPQRFVRDLILWWHPRRSEGDRVRRREFITLVGSVVGWPLAARAQQPAMPVIGYLSQGSPETDAVRVAGLRRGLNEAGYVEGRTVTIEYRWSGSQVDRCPRWRLI
jgi:putative ABC transport system substrate-binding protein